VTSASHVRPIASAWVAGFATGLENTSPRMQEMIFRRVWAFSARLARRRIGVHDGGHAYPLRARGAIVAMAAPDGERDQHE
jgi:hypothetical protein